MILSYIIPVYNTEKYIEQCVSSVVNATSIDSKDYEIILINDGSKDDSLNVIKKLAEKFNNIVIFDQPNGGASCARNKGLANASGEYVAFVDSDDYFIDQDLKPILSILRENKYDMVACPRIGREKVSNKVYDRKAALGLLVTGTAFMSGPCSKFFKRELVEKNNLRFSIDMTISEDTNFIINCVSKIDTLLVHDTFFYIKRPNPISLTNQFHENYFSFIDRNFTLLKQLIVVEGCEEHLKDWNTRYLMRIARVFMGLYNNSKKLYNQRIKECKKSKNYIEAIKHTSVFQFKLKNWLHYFVARYSFKFLCPFLNFYTKQRSKKILKNENKYIRKHRLVDDGNN